MRGEPLAGLGVALPVLAAPLGGGPGNGAMVRAAGEAGSLGFLAGGYKHPDAMAGEIAELRAAATPFGVNLFAPNPLAVEPAAYARYAALLAETAAGLGVELPQQPREDDDWWEEKLALLGEDPVPVVSFTFGLPAPAELARLRRAGSLLVQTVTSPREAVAAAEAGVDALIVQSHEAGGHWGTLTPAEPPERVALPPLLESVAAACSLPLIGAGGFGSAEDLAAALACGAAAGMVGTALMLAPEGGTSATHRAALAERSRETVATRAFTGRPARGLRNGFIDRFEAQAPLGYPALHHLTAPLRRAAAAARDPELLHLWAGTGYREARSEPVGDALRRLSALA